NLSLVTLPIRLFRLGIQKVLEILKILSKAVIDVLTSHHPKPQSKSGSVIFSGRTFVSPRHFIKNKASGHLLGELDYLFERLPLLPSDETVTDHKKVGSALCFYLPACPASIFQKKRFRGLVIEFEN